MRHFIAVLLLACGFGVAAAAAATGGSRTMTTKAAPTAPAVTPPVPTAMTASDGPDPIAEHVYIRQILRLKRATWRLALTEEE